MTEHSLPQRGEILRLGELCEERQFSFFCCGRQNLFAVFPDSKKPCVEVASVFGVFLYIFFLYSKHNMKKRPVNAGLCYLFCLEEFAELFIIEKIIQLSADSVCQLQ